MTTNISNRQRASTVGILIILAYSMLAYSITKNAILGFITDVISGLAVIGIPLFMLPVFNTYGNKNLNVAYLISRLIEGILMIMGGIFILNPSLEKYRDIIYQDIHIYFFIVGALFFYILFYRTQTIPKYISIWGIVATVALLIKMIINLFGVTPPSLNALIIPIVLNELYLALWLIIKGFNPKTID